MKKQFVASLTLLGILACSAAAFAADWKPVEGKIMTDFAKDVDPQNPLPEYPRPQMERDDWLNLNGLWDYAIREKDAAASDQFDGKILVPYPIESALSGVGKRVGQDKTLWYQRTFSIPRDDDWAGRRVMLQFGAVDWDTTVFVNGKEVGKHVGGYSPFGFDITDALKAEGEQTVTLRVFDPTTDGIQPYGKQHNRPGGIWYTPVTGIWQTVWIEPVPATSIDSIKLTPSVTNSTLTIETTITGLQDGDMIEAEATIEVAQTRVRERTMGRRGGRRVVNRVNNRATAVDVKATGKAGEPLVLNIPNPQLWTPDTPNLYDLNISIVRNGKAVDTVDSYFGMREVSIGKDKNGITRMLLNGEFVFQHGPLDQGWWPDGLYTAPTDKALRYDVEMTKAFGYNMLRKHVKTEPARFYYHCDQLGMLVWQDMPNSGGHNKHIGPAAEKDADRPAESKANFEMELEEMIAKFYNYPSIIVWVPFNEGWGQYDTNRVLEWTKKLDPTRLIDGPSGWKDRGYGDMIDMHAYRGPGMPALQEGRASVLGEYGGLGLPIKDHTWVESDKNWGYGGNLKDSDDLLQTYQQLNAKMHPLIAKGLSAAVYTQTTDVEVEVNGLMTYDRKVVKVDVEKFKAANDALRLAVPETKTLVPTAATEAAEWSFTAEQPADGWEKADFDDSAWKKGQSGFGTKQTPNTTVGTEWNTSDIWIRRSFELKAEDVASPERLLLDLYHDEDAEVFVNGVKVLSVKAYIANYTNFAPSDFKAFKPGKNVIAIHCKQTTGGQYIDAGVILTLPTKDNGKRQW